MKKEQGDLYSRYLANESIIRDKDFINLGTKLENIVWSLQSINIDFNGLSINEKEALAKLYSRERPIFIAELIHFKLRMIPLLFLEVMNEDTDESLSDIELAKVIYKHFENENFINRAKKRFFIEV